MSRRKTKPNEWMPLHIDAWRTKTRRLSPLERSAYMELLMEYWDSQKPLHVDHDDFANLIGIPRDQWDVISERVLRFFDLQEDGLLHNERMDEEIAKASRIMQQRQDAGRKGGLKGSKTEASAYKNGTEKRAIGEATGTEGGTHPRGLPIGVAEERHDLPPRPQPLPHDAVIEAAIRDVERTARRATRERRTRGVS